MSPAVPHPFAQGGVDAALYVVLDDEDYGADGGQGERYAQPPLYKEAEGCPSWTS